MRVNVIAELAKRRAYRVARGVDLSVGGSIGEFERELRAGQRRVKRAGVVVEDVLPGALAGLCEGVSVRGGVLTIRAVDSAAKFRISQWLRGGGEGEVRARARVRGVRVR